LVHRSEKKVIQINEEAIKDHLGKLVRSTVEETLNGMLDAEANRLCNAEKYQRSGARIDTRRAIINGSYIHEQAR